MSKIITELQAQVFEDLKKSQLRSEDERYLRAAAFWWQHKGDVPSSIISKSLLINNDRLTRMIRDQIANRYEIKITDTTPQVEIHRTKDSIDAQYPNASPHYFEHSHTLELFYYLAHPEKIQRPCQHPTTLNDL